MSLQRPSIRYGAQIVLGIVSLLLLASPILASPLQQNCATMGFNPTTTVTHAGETAVLQVLLDADGVTFDTVGFKINFDPTVLQVVDAAGDPASRVEPGDNLPGIEAMNIVSDTIGTIDFAQIIIGGQPGGTFTVATIRFKVIAALSEGTTQVMFVDGQGNTGVFYTPPPPPPGQPTQQLLCEFPGPATITWVPKPVGGIVVPVNKLELLAPWLGLAVLASLAALTVALVRRPRSI
jgi:hypothetical protein